MKFFWIFFGVLFSGFSSAHQIDIASIIFSKTGDGKTIVQITSSLTAFQSEINYNNKENSYATPEEFQELVEKHVQKNFKIKIDGSELKLINLLVILGHETKIVAEVQNFPKIPTSIFIKNEIFKDIHSNQSIIIFSIKDLLENRNFEINKDVGYQLNLVFKDGVWQRITKQELKINRTQIFFCFIALAILFALVYLFFKNKKR
ncbi:DUF6702 family protein [Frigoriflavimonas asaccharolytica]|uniref:LPXTG-motif cell wall-anchored protein n=1 Tax=Frigoriflavimonas asaccharolytica TaxID=2735899 RepID=A0A8J8GA13_9FLAO|nr:DUF6702 family protein [Frigoriflavimonas asaccharolytica]NRS92095.1 hypothetical protein [Frigoriflavimonas asaccharolytica]